MQLRPCDTKQYYDTEWEAKIAAAKTEWFLGQEMVEYQCPNGPHWHITHVDHEQRRGVGHKYWRCPKCKAIVRKKNAFRHKCNVE